MDYQTFLEVKAQLGDPHGFEPLWFPDCLMDFQRHLVDWHIRQGRSLNAADCGLGKTLMELVWAQNVVMKTNRPVLIAAPPLLRITPDGAVELMDGDEIAETFESWEVFCLWLKRFRARFVSQGPAVEGPVGTPEPWMVLRDKIDAELKERHDDPGAGGSWDRGYRDGMSDARGIVAEQFAAHCPPALQLTPDPSTWELLGRCLNNKLALDYLLANRHKTPMLDYGMNWLTRVPEPEARELMRAALDTVGGTDGN